MPQLPLSIAFTKEEIDLLTDKWSDSEISSHTGYAYSRVWKARRHHGVKTFTQKTGNIKIGKTGEIRKKGSVRGAIREDNLDDHYFENIDSPVKAYWLGVLLADGWSSLRGGVPKEVGLALKVKDEGHLETFKLDTGYSGRITRKLNENSLSKDGKSIMSSIRITCQRFTKYAIKAGIKLKKSGQLEIPIGAYNFPSDFLRGFADGDGSIGTKNFTIICGSPDFQTQLMLFISDHTGHDLYPEAPLSPTTGKPCERLTGYRKDKPVLDWMYKNAERYLPRKLDKYYKYWK
ncbi:hypothetical protein [Prochlorococcus sp. MIT 1306]|uniref:hypothetical protein n=1 Tax=Prochlorococcus sp. MIT 1306 TaxID=1799667 RepID=UPI0007B36F86|nr:hypothetical protein [Prochlorococcus sp. MIT 1306]KZR64315.1 hypothetical protein PMIT1306_01289 [Prochlorococcus sp. MIT 1306]